MKDILEYIDYIEQYKREEKFSTKKRDRVFYRTKVEYRVEALTSKIEEMCAIAVIKTGWPHTHKRGDVNDIPNLLQIFYHLNFVAINQKLIQNLKSYRQEYGKTSCLYRFSFDTGVNDFTKKSLKNYLTKEEVKRINLLTNMFNSLNKEL
jgi:predicted NodU family carbamoyl transferase